MDPNSSALYRSIHEWTPLEHMIVSLIDLTAWGNHQRSGKRTGGPKPTKRPGQGPKRIKPQARTIAEYDEILGWSPPRA